MAEQDKCTTVFFGLHHEKRFWLYATLEEFSEEALKSEKYEVILPIEDLDSVTEKEASGWVRFSEDKPVDYTRDMDFGFANKKTVDTCVESLRTAYQCILEYFEPKAMAILQGN